MVKITFKIVGEQRQSEDLCAEFDIDTSEEYRVFFRKLRNWIQENRRTEFRYYIKISNTVTFTTHTYHYNVDSGCWIGFN